MLNSIKTPYVVVQPSDTLRQSFANAFEQDQDNAPERIKRLSADQFQIDVQLEDVKWLKTKLKSGDRLYKLLEMSGVTLPAPEQEPRNPELEARVQKLKLMEEQYKYQAMTKNVDTSRIRHPEDTIAYQVKEMNRQLIGVLQVLVSISAGFAFGFIGIEYIVGNLDLGARILLGILSAMVIAIAEIYFFLKKLEESDSEDQKQKKKTN